MRIIAASLGVSLLLLSHQAGLAAPKLGKYLCVTDHAAGIVTGNNANLVASRIELPPERQKFFVTITQWKFHDDACYSQKQMDALRTYDPLADHSLEAEVDRMSKRIEANEFSTHDDPEPYAYWCLSNFQAKFEKYGPMMSMDGFLFRTYGDWVTFRLFENGEFHFYELDSYSPGRADYVYRGRCELIQ